MSLVEELETLLVGQPAAIAELLAQHDDVCDVCEEPVAFDPVTRTFSHHAQTWCRGIDGVVLSSPHKDRVERRRAVPAALHLLTPSLVEQQREARDVSYLAHYRRRNDALTAEQDEEFSVTRPTLDPSHTLCDNPLSSAAMRFALFPKASTDSTDSTGSGTFRPFGLRRVESHPRPEPRSVSYCHRRQVAVDESGEPLVSRSSVVNDGDSKPKEWGSKTYSDGDEGQEESNWGWEEA